MKLFKKLTKCPRSFFSGAFTAALPLLSMGTYRRNTRYRINKRLAPKMRITGELEKRIFLGRIDYLYSNCMLTYSSHQQF